ncbi:hypothetical protein Ancab_005634 [Ancistrocladus abbreviatus]
MGMEGRLNLLDEALGLDNQSKQSSLGGSKMMLIEDCLETSGAFVVHHIMKHSLCSDSFGIVIFVALSHPFSHYDRILRKLGCNLAVHRDSKRIFFFDMLMLECPAKGGLIELYGKIQNVVEVISSSQESKRCITIIVDDFSLIEVAVNGDSNQGVDFLRYCHSLTTEFGCFLVVLNHSDIYDGLERQLLWQMEYLTDILVKVEPLATGRATDVHGQLTVVDREICNGRKSRSKLYNFHFKLKENGIECFYPGSQT